MISTHRWTIQTPHHYPGLLQHAFLETQGRTEILQNSTTRISQLSGTDVKVSVKNGKLVKDHGEVRVCLGSSLLPTMKWWDAPRTTTCDLLLRYSSTLLDLLWAVTCQDITIFFSVCFQDQWSWAISCDLLHRTSDSPLFCSPGHNGLIASKRNEN